MHRSGELFVWQTGMSGNSNRGRDSGFGKVQCFCGACLLTVALLLPHAPLAPVLAGLALAGLIQWGWWHSGGGDR